MPVTYTLDRPLPQIGFPPMPAVARILSHFDRKSLEAFISIAIDLADLSDGDADLELNGDEFDGAIGEDDPLFNDEHPLGADAPGCLLSDPDIAVDDIACDEEQGL